MNSSHHIFYLTSKVQTLEYEVAQRDRHIQSLQAQVIHLQNLLQVAQAERNRQVTFQVSQANNGTETNSDVTENLQVQHRAVQTDTTASNCAVIRAVKKQQKRIDRNCRKIRLATETS